MKLCANACNDCRRCRAVRRALAEKRAVTKLLRQAMTVLEAVDFDLAFDLQNYSAREIRAHAGLRTKLGLRTRIAKMTRQLPST